MDLPYPEYSTHALKAIELIQQPFARAMQKQALE
jgi:hypothetical protein